MKVIFLDVDGVLNYIYCKAKSPCGVIGVDDCCMDVLSKIVKKSESIIVLVSTWKYGWSDDSEFGYEDSPIRTDFLYLTDALNKHGIQLTDRTYDGNNNRGWGIAEWLKEHPNATDWVVIDDDMFPDYEEYGIIPHLVQPSFYTGGLKEEHIKQCLDILNITEE